MKYNSNIKSYGGSQMYNENGVSKEHIYYNIRIDNPIDGTDNSASRECVYNKQTQPIIEKQSDYEMAIESWSLRAVLPVFVATIQQGTNTNINLMPFSVCYSYTTGGVTTNFQTFLVWQPDYTWTQAPNQLPKAPNDNNGIQDLITSPHYYDCNNFQRFVDIINNALKTSYDAFNAAHPAVHTEECWVQYDTRTGLFSIVGELSYAVGAGGIGTNKAFVFFDALLYKYIDSIPAGFNGYNNNFGKDYDITFEQKNGGSNAWVHGNPYAGEVVNPQTSPPAYIIMDQENDCRSLWNNIKQIIISSTSITVRNEFMPFIEFPQKLQERTDGIPTGDTPLNPDGTYQNVVRSDINTFGLEKKNIISYIDYNYASPQMAIQSSKHRDIFYKPHFYKWVDLTSDTPLNNVNIEVQFETEDGFILPVNIPNKASCSIKLAFRRK